MVINSPEATPSSATPREPVRRKFTLDVRNLFPSRENTLRVDRNDLLGRQALALYTGAVSAVTALAVIDGSTLITPEIHNVLLPNMQWGEFVWGVAMLTWLGTNHFQERKLKNDVISQSYHLGSHAERFVYKGKKIEGKDFTLSRNSNFRYLRMPQFVEQHEQINREQANAILDFYQYAINDLNRHMYWRKESTKAILMDADAISLIHKARDALGLPPEPALNDALGIIRQQAFQGKNRNVKEPWKREVLIGRETFKDLKLRPDEEKENLVEDGVKVLAERLGQSQRGKLMQLYDRVQYSTGDQVAVSMNALKSYLQALYRTQGETHFAGAESARTTLPVQLTWSGETDASEATQAPVQKGGDEAVQPLFTGETVMIPPDARPLGVQAQNPEHIIQTDSSNNVSGVPIRERNYYSVREIAGSRSRDAKSHLVRHNDTTGMQMDTGVDINQDLASLLFEVRSLTGKDRRVTNFTALRLARSLVRYIDDSQPQQGKRFSDVDMPSAIRELDRVGLELSSENWPTVTNIVKN